MQKMVDLNMDVKTAEKQAEITVVDAVMITIFAFVLAVIVLTCFCQGRFW